MTKNTRKRIGNWLYFGQSLLLTLVVLGRLVLHPGVGYAVFFALMLALSILLWPRRSAPTGTST